MTKQSLRRFGIGWTGRSLLVLAVAVLAIGLAACGDSDSSDSTTAATEGTANNETSGGGDSEAGSSIAAAKEVIAPYIGQPSPFPVTEKLKEIPKGATIAVMDCGAPTCGLFWELLQPAAKTMGVTLERFKAGQAANTVSAAFDAALATEPDAVIVLAINVPLWSKALKELQESQTPIVTLGIADAEEFGIESPQAGIPATELIGKLLANYVAAEMGKNVVVYEVPEVTSTTQTVEFLTPELEAACPECSVRAAKVSAAEIGNTAASTIVSDLQANPETEVAVFTLGELSLGLSPALKAAGIEVETLSAGPTPANLQLLKEGKETAGLAIDLPVLMWTMIDQTAREIVGQELTGLESEGLSVQQFLTQEDITFDPSKGWTGYPDFAERFAKLWGVGG